MHPNPNSELKVAMRFYKKRLQSAVNCSDRSDGLRSGMQYININHTAPDEEEVETPHCSDWAHIVTHLMKGRLISKSNPSYPPPHRALSPTPSPSQGRLIPKSNPYFGEVYFLLLAIHLAHSTEQHTLITEHVVELFKWWESHGLLQQGKYTTETLRETHLKYPWNTFSIATYDGMLSGCHDFPLILPSNQAEESWHKGLMKLLQGKLRGSTDFVLNVSLARILLDDTINMPRQLCFEPVNINVCCRSLTASKRPISLHLPMAVRLLLGPYGKESSPPDGRGTYNDPVRQRGLLRPALQVQVRQAHEGVDQ
jgi:hypothetical protein